MKCLPERHAIASFGNGGFRFADHSHKGHLLILPSGICAWDGVDMTPVFAQADAIDFLILGTGLKLRRIPAALAARLRAAGVSADAMCTSAAVHSYNLMFAEGRLVAAGFQAVP